jgi:hypothetical protein
MPIRAMTFVFQAFLSLALTAGAANAVTFPLGTLPDVSAGTEFGAAWNHFPSEGGPFFDTWNIHATGPLLIVGQSQGTTHDGEGYIQNLTLSWIGGFGSLAATNSSGVDDVISALGFAILSAGDYAFTVAGTLIGGDPQAYSFKFAASAIPDDGGPQNVTPIPPALVLFGSALAGLGLLGRRPRRASPETSA